MKFAPWITLAAMSVGGAALAQDSNALNVEGEGLVTEAAALAKRRPCKRMTLKTPR